MSLAAGTRLGPYDVSTPLGAGGMGEVYRARDGRLSRDVAIKVLPGSFAADAERLRRFEQEARAAGLLNHPNILQVHDVGTHDGAPYVVSELLEGETLRERIAGAPMPVRKAIDLAAQIARGLAAAHHKGIVHRDLKPDNVFVTTDGRVKILDFGLAKLAGDALAEAETHTRGTPGTEAGKVMGTVGYMSPEQVRARPVDHRSDIFSFGSVLYEMLSGRRAFRGASAVETMNAILKEDPPELSATNRRLPPGLERIVAHCLEKNPDERFQSASDIAFDLEQLSAATVTAEGRAPGAAGRLLRRRWLAGALLAGAVIAAAFLAGRRSVPVAALPAFRAVTFQRGTVARARYAADRRAVVYAAQWGDGPLDVYEAKPGSPESRSLGLADATLESVARTGEMALLVFRGRPPGRTLARQPMGGGAPREVTDHVMDADWAPDASSLAVVRAGGGRHTVEYPIGTPLYAAVSVTNIRVAPTGDHVAFADHPLAGDNRGEIAVVDRAGKKRTLSSGWSDIRGLAWSPDGDEVWFSGARSGTDVALWAVTLDGRERTVYRGPGGIVIQDTTDDGRVLVSVLRGTSSLFARVPGESRDRDLSWLDWSFPADLTRDGKTLLFTEQGQGGGSDYATYVRRTDGSAPVRLGKGNAFALSPDGRFAVVLNLGEPPHLDLLPTGAGEPRSLPRGPIARFQAAAFFPDGQRLVISGNEEGKGRVVFLQDIAGGDPRPISSEGVTFFASRYSNTITPDGRRLVGRKDGQLVVVPVDGGEPIPVKGSQASDIPLRFGADGRSLYVRSDVPGQGSRPPVRIVRLDLETGARQPWMEVAPPRPPYAVISAVIVAPESGAYAYSYNLPVAALYEASGLR